MTLRQKLDRLLEVQETISALDSNENVTYSGMHDDPDHWRRVTKDTDDILGLLSDPNIEWFVEPKQYRPLTPQEMADFLGTEVLCGERVLKINGIHLDFIDLNSITHFVYVGYTDMMTVPRYSDGQLVFRKEVT